MTTKSAVLDDRFILHETQLGPETGPVNFAGFFDPAQPVQIEIGSGSGTTLIHLAKTNPRTNFVGIEWSLPFYRHSANRLRKHNILNAKMLRTDAKFLFTSDRVAAQTLAACHIYFPDPWPKKRHHKRRTVDPRFCAALAHTIIPGGKVYIASDHEEYFQQMEASLLSRPEFTPCDFDSPAGTEVVSNFEAKFIKEGRRIYRFAVKKV
ncbi:MAG: tRNA (guanosine(46)-N7)-methyltransferase TrmB [Phycisphaerae bacterium]|jgi:tRNA (guanine-N7-)-methyltransferase|nr:tRNA (guanosine(46)-N7)-methyltransferase TrmB [Phycisphaerae bacterium]